MILITGHKGFVGSHLTKLIDSMGVSWIGYDLVDGEDIRDKFKLESLFRDNSIDTVIHLAALAHPVKSMMFPEEYISTNINGTQNLLECAKRHDVKHLVFFSSSSIYGEEKPPNDEKTPYSPASIYAMTKVAGEMLVKMSGVPYTIIRPFTVYGENGRKDQVIYKWINLIREDRPIVVLGNGDTKRGYTYVKDLVGGVWNVLGNDAAMNQTFNLGGTEIISIQELADIFKEVTNCEIEYRELPKGDPYENWADISKAKEILGYNPKENFKRNVINILQLEL